MSRGRSSNKKYKCLAMKKYVLSRGRFLIKK